MTIAILFFLAFTVTLLVLKLENKLTIVFALGFISIMILMISLAFYTIRISNYRYFFDFEFYIVKYMGSIKISYHDIKYFMLAGITAFLSLMLYFFLSGSTQPRMGKGINILITGVFIVFTCLFIYFNSSICDENIYLATQYAQSSSKIKLLMLLRHAISAYSLIYIITVCILPYIRFFTEWRSTKIFYREKFLVSLAVSIFILQAMFLFILFVTPLRYYLFNSSMYDIATIVKMYNKPFDYYILIITSILLTVLGFLCIKSYVLSDSNFLTTHRKNKKMKFIMKDVRHIFHTFKNFMVLISVLADKAIQTSGTDESIENLEEIRDNANLFFEKTKKFLDIQNQPDYVFDTVNIADCVNMAVNKVEKISKIRASVNIECENTYVYGNGEDFTEVFLNLISNSADAIKQDGKIIITIWEEDKWICVSVWDNGSGIERKMLKRIFRPFCSSKKNFNNWGIGLSYVKKVVEAYSGFICVKSTVDLYSEFQVIFPKAQE